MKDICLNYKRIDNGLNLEQFIDRLCNVVEKDLVNNNGGTLMIDNGKDIQYHNIKNNNGIGASNENYRVSNISK